MNMPKLGNNLKWALILPLVVVLVSGCTLPGGGTGVSGKGIVIKSFEPSLKDVESDENLLLHLEVQNQGDVKGRAAAKLIGISPTEWGVFQTDQLLDDLVPADPERGTEGAVATADWRLTSPNLKKGESVTYEPMVRVYYSYETRAKKPVWFVTSDELRRIVQNGQSLQSETTQVTGGPLSVNIKTGEFIRTKEENYMQSYFPIQIDITNTGGGLIAGENYPIGIEVELPDGVMFKSECPPRSQTEWTGSFYDMSLPAGLTRPISPKTILMWNGKDAKITCELKVITPPSVKDKRDISVTLKYIYYTDAETQVHVTGTEEWGY